MTETRVIPVLLIENASLVKTTKFRKPVYLGDPINTAKIFNDKEAHELLVLDIRATKNSTDINYSLLSEIATECFMPIGYGGGIRSVQECGKLISSGMEKVVFNTAAFDNPLLIEECAKEFGSQSVVVCIDVDRALFGGYNVMVRSGTGKVKGSALEWAKRFESHGAGEIIIQAIHREGTMTGYDIDITRSVAESVEIPVIASGGASKVSDFGEAIHVGKATAVSAGSLFVFSGPHRALLVNFPESEQLLQYIS